MAHCKHWKNGHCKDCRKNCPIKKKLLRAAARHVADAATPCTEPAPGGATPLSTLAEALTHGEHVAHLAALLYTGLEPLHRLDASWAAVLDTAARLHDVGWVYGQKGHHKTSARMIRVNAPCITLPSDALPAESCATAPDEDNAENTARRELAALVARYHRWADPSPRQRRFAELPGPQQRGVRRLAALLRLADALDYSHGRCVRHLEVVLEGECVRLVLESAGHCEEEMARLETKKALFKNIFKKDVLCQFSKQEAPAMPGSAVVERQTRKSTVGRKSELKPEPVKTKPSMRTARQAPKQGVRQPPRPKPEKQPTKAPEALPSKISTAPIPQGTKPEILPDAKPKTTEK